MRIAELMTQDVLVAQPSEPASEAWHRIRQARVNHLVVMEGSAVVGVISTRDLSAVRASGRGNKSVGELMKRGVLTASPTTLVPRAAMLMRGRSIGCLPVVDNGRLIGIVTVEDLLDWIHGHRDMTRLQGRWERSQPRSRWSRAGRDVEQHRAAH